MTPFRLKPYLRQLKVSFCTLWEQIPRFALLSKMTSILTKGLENDIEQKHNKKLFARSRWFMLELI